MATVDYNQYLVRKPAYEVGVQAVGLHKGHQVPSMTYMSNALVPGSNTYVEVSWIYDVPEPNPYVFEHAHNFDEIVMHIGSDPENPESLGGDMEISVEGHARQESRQLANTFPAGLPGLI